MKCPRCNEATDSVGTEPGTHGTRRRQYRCANAHRFTTLETYEPKASSVERTSLMNALRAINARFESPRRNP